MALLDSSVGFMLVCTWVNAMFYALELQQVYTFFMSFPKERLSIKGVVLFAVLWDTIGTVACNAALYQWCVTYWGVPTALALQRWPIVLYAVAIGINAAVVQSFLTWRLYVLSKQMIFVIVFGAWTLTAMGGAFAAAGTIARYPSISDRDKLVTAAIVFVVCAPTLDIALAIFLVLYFHKSKTGFKKTDSLLRRLIAQAISSGTVTCLFAIPALITFLWNKESAYPQGITMMVGRVYTLTMLFNLNQRVAFRGVSNRTQTSGPSYPDTQDPINMLNIRVDRSTVVGNDATILDDQKKSYGSEPNLPYGRDPKVSYVEP